MVFAPVGIRCPDHASIGAPKPSAARTARQVRGTFTRHPAPVTLSLIIVNFVVFVAMVSTGGSIGNTYFSSLFQNGALVGQLVGQGDWWRLATSMFLHASFIHVAMNMFVLWAIGTVVEQALGSWRFILVYLVSGLAGSAGALLLPLTRIGGHLTMHYYPGLPTVGASGAIFGIMGSLLVLEYLATGSLAGQAMALIVVNLFIGLALPNISIGGHIGGLIGGIAATYVLMRMRYRRPAFLGPALVVLVGVVSVALALARSRGRV
jgi:membrane associated rhomboid family serine protease